MDEPGTGATTLTSDVAPPGDAPPPPPGASGRRRGRWLQRASVPVLLAVVAGVWWLGGGEARPNHPLQWDERVKELAAYVEYERGLDFKHPVEINYLPEKDFVAEVTSEASDLTDEDKAELEDFESLFRAVGLARGDFDLFGAGNQLRGDSTLAYYDPETEEVTVRGTEMTIGVEVTLVHELTHVLQDQHFDLERAGSFDTDAQNSAFDAVVEGDAQRIEKMYLDELSEEAYDAYFDEIYPESGEQDTGGDGAIDVPAWLSAYNEAPYVLGEPLTSAVFGARGQKGLDAMFRTPPASEEHLLDPSRYLEGDKPKTVALPKLAKGDRKIDEGDFGTFTWLVMLAERIPVEEAVAAVDGWGGDSYIAFERNGRVCTVARFVGDDGAETTQMEAALRTFAGAMPEGAVTVTRRGGMVEILACDPGSSAEEPGDGGAYDALSLVVGRASTFAFLVSDDVEVAQAACLAAGIVEEFTPDEMSAEEIDGFERRMQPIRDRCAEGLRAS